VQLSANNLQQLSANNLVRLPPRRSGKLCLLTRAGGGGGPRGGLGATAPRAAGRGGGGAHVRVVRDQVLEGDAGVVRGAGVRQHAHPEATAASHTQLVGVLPEWGRSVSPSLRAGPQNLGAHTQLTTGDTLPLGKTALSKYLVMLEGFQELVRWSRWSTGACRTG